MRVAVFGAGGGVGRHLVRQAAQQGVDVVAVQRSSVSAHHDGEGGSVVLLTGDVRDRHVLNSAVAGVDAVLWCVGVTATSGGDVGRTVLPTLVDVMAEHGVARFVGVSGAGADLPGDRKGRGARLVSAVTHRLARDLVEDKEGEYAVLSATSLSWTQVRPPRLTDRAGTGRYRLTDQAPGLRSPAVARADVAAAMLDLATAGAAAGPDTPGRPPVTAADAAGQPAPRGQWFSAAPYLVAGPS